MRPQGGAGAQQEPGSATAKPVPSPRHARALLDMGSDAHRYAGPARTVVASMGRVAHRSALETLDTAVRSPV